MNVLNKVKIENTFRITATSALEAATVAVNESHYKTEAVTLVLGEDLTFVATLNLGRNSDIVVNHVLFVELVSTGKYRVEVGSVNLSEFELTHLTGGDEAVNAIGFYKSEMCGKVISTEEYSNEVAYWVDNDVKEGSLGRMESYIKRKFTKVSMVNGNFESV